MKYSSFFYKKWMRFLTWFGDIQMATEPPKAPTMALLEALFLARSGDIVFRKYDYYLDSYFIPGAYTHSGVVTHLNRIFMNEARFQLPFPIVTHAMAEGLRADSLFDFMKLTDGFMLYRPHYVRNEDKLKMLQEADRLHGLKLPYDGLFREGEEALYCHEYTAETLKEACFEIKPAKGKILLADDIIRCVPGDVIIKF